MGLGLRLGAGAGNMTESERGAHGDCDGSKFMLDCFFVSFVFNIICNWHLASSMLTALLR